MVPPGVNHPGAQRFEPNARRSHLSLRWVIVAGIVLAQLGACGDDVAATPDATACDVADDAHRATCKAMDSVADAFTCAPQGLACVDIGDGAFCCKAGAL